jgi:hypothetical protein
MTAARRFVWRYPHWWAVVLFAGAWGWIAARWWGSSHGHRLGVVDWMLMVGAMMLPLVFGHLRLVAGRSLWPRRQRAMAAFLCGYAAVSMLAGVVVISIVSAADIVVHVVGTTPMMAMAFALAAAWQVVPLKRRALTACHRTVPLAPRGWRAHRDCLLYGWTIGRSCLVSCAGLMLACVLAGHSLPAMMAATVVAGAERVSARANAWTTAAALALAGAAHIVGMA